MPQLDGLRAVAVTLVLLSHCWLTDSSVGHHGVRIFFVLSGFLITGILLDLRQRIANLDATSGFVWRAFFLRRALRIFPAYFAFLGVLLLIGVPGLREQLPWHLFFLTNVSLFLNGNWEPWQVNHLWSLSVEEQFYLLWPALVLLAPRSALAPTFFLLVALAVLWRVICLKLGMVEFGPFLTPASFDALAGGAMIALAVQSGWRRRLKRACLCLAPLWVVLTAVIELQLLPLPASVVLGVVETLGSVVFVGIVAAASANETGRIVGQGLSWAPLCWVGRISYGIYLYHVLVLWILTEVINRTQIIPFRYGPELFLLCFALTTLLAAASWRFLERPFLRIKNRVPYLPTPQEVSKRRVDAAE